MYIIKKRTSVLLLEELWTPLCSDLIITMINNMMLFISFLHIMSINKHRDGLVMMLFCLQVSEHPEDDGHGR